ncbi:MAG: hypothetical protein EAX96_06725 [Candidatus Lokiarchaeota archaeon]|nr:hypothetical protein [Candidatus Lokiarchaeota archaeon]
MADKKSSEEIQPGELKRIVPRVTYEIVGAFNLLNAPKDVAEFYSFILSNPNCSTDQIQSQFHRKTKNLEFLKSYGWIKSSKGTEGETLYNVVPPNTILDPLIDEKEVQLKKLQKEVKKLEDDVMTLNLARRDLLALSKEGFASEVLNTPDDFYRVQGYMCRNAKKNIIAVTDRWLLALYIQQLDNSIKIAAENGVDIRILGRIEDEDPSMCRELAIRARDLLDAGAKVRVLNEKVRIRFMVIDEESVFFAVRPPKSLHRGSYIRHPDFAKNFVDEMEILWEKAEKPDELIKKYLKS